jgi:hypothetical protein
VDWQQYSQGNIIGFEGYILSLEVDEIKVELSKFWDLLLSKTIEMYQDKTWEGLLCTMWSDSGRFIAYPFSPGELLKRNEKIFVQVHIALLEKENWDLDYDPNADETEQQEFNMRYELLTKKYWHLLAQALETEPAKSTADKIKRQRSFVVLGCEEEPVNHEVFSIQ